MDKSLDDIIKSRKGRRTTRGGPRRPGRSPRAKVLGTSNASAVKAAAKKAAVTQAPTKAIFAPQSAEKIIVSGLPLDVNEQQIKELFTTTVGPTKSIQMQFNPQGKWLGAATIVFSRQGDAAKAYQEYNNRLIDGKRPMKIELILDPSKVAPLPLSSRVAPAAGAAAVGGTALTEGVQRTGRVGRPKRPRRARNSRPPKTAEDLDAEMEDYAAENSAPVAASAA